MPKERLSDAMDLSPCSTLMVTVFWLSAAVVKIWLFLVGMVVLRSINFVNTLPNVSTP